MDNEKIGENRSIDLCYIQYDAENLPLLQGIFVQMSYFCTYLTDDIQSLVVAIVMQIDNGF